MSRSLEQDVDFFLVDGPGYTEVEAYAFLAGLGRNTSTLPPLTAAANAGHTGAMIALVPSDADAKRLKVRGGEARDELHLTLLYLGEADAISDDARQKIVNGVMRLADATTPIEAQGFSINAFNPAGDEPCLVLGVGNAGTELDDVHRSVTSIVRGIGVTYPEQHTPWVPHVTLQYTDDMGQVAKLAKKTGPVTFDHIRVAFAGDVTDIPLGKVLVAHGSHDQSTHGNWSDGADEPFEEVRHLLMTELQGKMKSWTTNQIRALRDYTSANYKDINKALRRPGLMSVLQRGKIAEIKSAMAPLPRNIKVWRGTGFGNFGVDNFDSLKKLVGTTLVDKGFMSTTIDPGHKFPNSKIRVVIEVPKGTKAAYIGDMSNVVNERELLLDAGTKIRIDDVKMTFDGFYVFARVVTDGD